MTAPQAVDVPHALKHEWTGWAIGSAALTLAAGVILALRVGAGDAVRWAVPALVVSAYTLTFARRRLAANHPASSATLFPTLGPGNRLTLVRGLLIAFMAGFILMPGPTGGLAWAPMILYTLSDVCDYFDGYLARRARHQTLLGGELDIEFDALGLLLAVSVAIRLGALPPWYLVIGLSRYAFLFGGWVLRSRGRVFAPLPPSISRRPIAGLTMGFTSAVLWPILPPAVTHLAAHIFAVPICFSFLRDWLVVSGTVGPQSPAYLRLRASAKRWLLGWLPLPVRLAALLSGAILVANQLRA
jgi:CDP-diacylglycerol--glycerol-3-phosphate 3-phosphatidyltransferase